MEVRPVRVGEGERLLRTGAPPAVDLVAAEALAAGPGAVLIAEHGGEWRGAAGVRPLADAAELWFEWADGEDTRRRLLDAAAAWAYIRGLRRLEPADSGPEVQLDRPDRTIRTERLTLRPFTDGDLDAVHAMRSREDVVRFLYDQPSTLDEDRERLVARSRDARFAYTGDGLAFAAEHDGTVVGDCSLYLHSAEHHQGEVGFIVHPDHQGRGYATEAARAVLELGFAGFGLHRIVGRVEARNTASARVLERLGMRREAHLVENELVKGEWQSEMVYALLASEWGQSQSRRRK